MREVPPPPLDYAMDGWAYEEVFRLVPGWFGVRLQQLCVHQDGRRAWRKCDRAVQLPTDNDFLRGINNAVSCGARVLR